VRKQLASNEALLTRLHAIKQSGDPHVVTNVSNLLQNLSSEVPSQATSVKDLKLEIQSGNLDRIKTAAGTIWNCAKRDEAFRNEARAIDLIVPLFQVMNKPQNISTFYKVSGALAALTLSCTLFFFCLLKKFSNTLKKCKQTIMLQYCKSKMQYLC